MAVHVLDHPLIQHKLAVLRNKETPVKEFRELISEIADGCQIDVGASFGELRLMVPRQYRVECAAGTSFGEISTHGHPDSNPKGVICLTGGVSFGELEIHYV